MTSRSIKDNTTRNVAKRLEDKIAVIENIKQLPATASLKDVIDTINKITNSIKRK